MFFLQCAIYQELFQPYHRILRMESQACRPSITANRELWPLFRLLTVLTLGVIWLHHKLNLGPISLLYVKGGIVILVALFCLIALVSINLARLYASLLIFPFFAVTVLNDWLYDGAYWTFRTILRLFYMRKVAAFFALIGELGLFIVLLQMGKILFKRYCP